MAEIIRREVAAQPEPFTGERLTSAVDGQVQIEHYHRYLFARALVRDLDVLDVASGEGYGAALLAQVARSVVGVDYSRPTVRSATANFPRPNLRFLQADARACRWPTPPSTQWYHLKQSNTSIGKMNSCAKCAACCAPTDASSSARRIATSIPGGEPLSRA